LEKTDKFIRFFQRVYVFQSGFQGVVERIVIKKPCIFIAQPCMQAYGQFIEHLGKCIYEGIRAERVEDRKFYYPVKENFNPFGTSTDAFWGTGLYQYLKASPWEIIGKGEKVLMEKENPYTGKFAVNTGLGTLEEVVREVE
jgi:hypothetical protein